MHRYVLLLVDLTLVAVATLFALLLRENLEPSWAKALQIAPYLALTLLAAAPVLLAAGLNRSLWRFSSLVDYLRVAMAVLAIILLAVALGFLLNRMEGVSRSLPILQGLLMVCALIGVRVAMRLRHATRDRAPRVAQSISRPHETVLVVGLNAVTELFLRSVEEFAGDRVKVAGLLGRGERHRNRLLRLHPVLGIPEEVGSVLADLEVHGVLVDRIVITTKLDELSPAAREALLDAERRSDIQLDFFSERVVLNKASRPEPEIDDDRIGARDERAAPAAALMSHDPEPRAPRAYLRWKRVLDATAALLAIVVLSPVILVVGLVVVLDVGHSPIFWQRRPGAHGWPFKLYKFRTMGAAHDYQGRRLADAERVSVVGRFLRHSRLDELPQLYNILVGEMSFVGPRPLLPADQGATISERHSIRPGLTGWAQIQGGRELSASDKAALDVWYVKNASLGLDLVILFGTLRMLLLGERTNHDAIRSAWRELGLDRVRRGQVLRKVAVDAERSLLPKKSAGQFDAAFRLAPPPVPHASPSAGKRA